MNIGTEDSYLQEQGKCGYHFHSESVNCVLSHGNEKDTKCEKPTQNKWVLCTVTKTHLQLLLIKCFQQMLWDHLIESFLQSQKLGLNTS